MRREGEVAVQEARRLLQGEGEDVNGRRRADLQDWQLLLEETALEKDIVWVSMCRREHRKKSTSVSKMGGRDEVWSRSGSRLRIMSASRFADASNPNAVRLGAGSRLGIRADKISGGRNFGGGRFSWD